MHKQDLLRRAIITWAFCGACVGAPAASPVPMPMPVLDERGFIDVWALRRDAAVVETASLATADEHRCDTQAAPDPRSRARCQGELQRALAHERQLRDDFNSRWVPALLAAISKSDPVAEVVWRQCHTTPVLDRRDLESTCDTDAGRRAVAARRLRAIGFEPAFDHEEALHALGRRPARAQVQALVLRRFAAGDLGGYEIAAHHGGNAPRTAAELDEERNSLLINAVQQEAPRAFTFNSRMQNATDRLGWLRLVRPVTTPEALVWAAGTFHGGTTYTGRHDWLLGPRASILQYEANRPLAVGGADDADFMRSLHDVLAQAEASIDGVLAQEPRWSVFLLHRLGRQEWVPEQETSQSGRIAPGWAGTYVLARSFSDAEPTATPPGLQATVGSRSGQAWIRFPQGLDKADAALCSLRRSGGLSLWPQPEEAGGPPSPIGNLDGLSRIVDRSSGHLQPLFAPLAGQDRHPQVLVQCPQGEWPDNRIVRFVFFSGRTMVEVMQQQAMRSTLRVRHWERTSDTPSAAPLADTPPSWPTAAERLAWFETLAEQAEAKRVDPAVPAPLR
ncbi:MAG: hypothetical protein JOY84_18390 [Curvibacter sp.]|nr:hypothetical protein [Curvibacter sp.]